MTDRYNPEPGRIVAQLKKVKVPTNGNGNGKGRNGKERPKSVSAREYPVSQLINAHAIGRVGQGAPVVPVPLDRHGRVGRPSKYDEKFDDMLVHHMSGGGTLETFAAIAHVSIPTVHDWFKKHPGFLNAKKLGEPKQLIWWFARGRALVVDDPRDALEALGIEPFVKKVSVRTYKDDSVEEVIEYHVPRGNTGAFCFMMANMFDWHNVRNPVELTGKDGGPVQHEVKAVALVAGLTTGQLRELNGALSYAAKQAEDERDP